MLSVRISVGEGGHLFLCVGKVMSWQGVCSKTLPSACEAAGTGSSSTMTGGGGGRKWMNGLVLTSRKAGDSYVVNVLIRQDIIWMELMDSVTKLQVFEVKLIAFTSHKVW